MKKLWYIFVAILFVACNNAENGEDASTDSLTNNVVVLRDSLISSIKTEVAIVEPSLLELNQVILKSIKEKDYAALQRYIHPIKGIRFTPYSTVNLQQDIVIQKGDFSKRMQSEKKSVWGYYDGTGNTIELSLKDYFVEFVYNADFLNAEKITLNTSSSVGNMINNIPSAYPKSDYIESYYSGFNKDLDGMDWSALRLVFQSEEGKIYLIGIVHDQWTT